MEIISGPPQNSAGFPLQGMRVDVSGEKGLVGRIEQSVVIG
jgi:hypothetical protein